jgi:hypothetical protein
MTCQIGALFDRETFSSSARQNGIAVKLFTFAERSDGYPPIAGEFQGPSR